VSMKTDKDLRVLVYVTLRLLQKNANARLSLDLGKKLLRGEKFVDERGENE